jgi:hypothetical protein
MGENMKTEKEQKTKKLKTFGEFINALDFNTFRERSFYKTLKAYSDCLDIDESSSERNLDYFAEDPIPVERVIQFADLIIGYNDFSPKTLNKVLLTLFSKDGYGPCGDTTLSNDEWLVLLNNHYDFYMGREGSVCIYIKLKKTSANLWGKTLTELSKHCDECSLNNKYGQMFLRLWWD